MRTGHYFTLNVDNGCIYRIIKGINNKYFTSHKINLQLQSNNLLHANRQFKRTRTGGYSSYEFTFCKGNGFSEKTEWKQIV